jgi:ammonia channel protein AmtB
VDQAAIQLLGCTVVALYAATVTFVLLKLIDLTVGLRSTAGAARVLDDAGEREEVTGVRERRPGTARIALP